MYRISYEFAQHSVAEELSPLHTQYHHIATSHLKADRDADRVTFTGVERASICCLVGMPGYSEATTSHRDTSAGRYPTRSYATLHKCGSWLICITTTSSSDSFHPSIGNRLGGYDTIEGWMTLRLKYGPISLEYMATTSFSSTATRCTQGTYSNPVTFISSFSSFVTSLPTLSRILVAVWFVFARFCNHPSAHAVESEASAATCINVLQVGPTGHSPTISCETRIGLFTKEELAFQT
jgi:hypothetical protein